MEISELALKLIMVLIPGIISASIYEKLTIRKSWNGTLFIIKCILFGGLSYLFAQLIFNNIFCFNDISLNNFWNNLSQKEIPFSAIGYSCLISIFIGIIFTYFEFWKIFNKIAKKIKATNKYGDDSLYYYFLNSKEVSGIYLRDIKNNLTYKRYR